jgi:hypothetical protein
MTSVLRRAARPRRLLPLLLGIALVPLVAAPAQAQALRTWVSGVGDDVNPCSRTAPCKTFAGAISKTAAGGVISVLDPGGFGAVTITKSITIDGTDGYASITNTGTNGIVINAPGNADVTLRGLDIVGGLSGTTEGSCGGLSGVSVVAARSVRLDNVRITGQANAVQTPLTASSPDTFVDIAMTDLELTHNCDNGIKLEPAAGHPARVSVTDSFVTQSNVALRAGAGVEAWATNTRLNLNNTGVQLSGGVVHAGCGTETIGNATNGAFSDDVCPANVQPAPTAPTQPTTPTAPTVTYCRVPQLTGRTVALATKALKSAGCTVGKVARQKTSKKSKRGKVLAQGVDAGTEVRRGTKVRLTVGR